MYKEPLPAFVVVNNIPLEPVCDQVGPPLDRCLIAITETTLHGSLMFSRWRGWCIYPGHIFIAFFLRLEICVCDN